MMECFFQIQPHFPCANDGKINTVEFLNASRGIVCLVDQFGKLFKPVKNDLLGNIEKLHRIYRANEEEHGCLMKMILLEKQKGSTYGTESLLWLRRGLHFFGKFLSLLTDEKNRAQNRESLSSLLSKAYYDTLREHHNFFTRILFNTLCGNCPSRSEFLQMVGFQTHLDPDLLYQMIDMYVNSLHNNLELLTSFYKQHDIKPHL